LLYDLYKIFAGKPWEWLDIIYDVMGMLSGAALSGLKAAVKAAGITKGLGMAKGVSKLASNPATKGFMQTISSGVSGVFNMIKSAGNWLAKTLGLKWIPDVLAKAGNWLSANLIKPIASGVSTVAKGSSAFVKGAEKVVDKALQKTGNVVGLKNVGNKTLSKASNVTVGAGARQGTIGGAKYKVKNDYVVNPALTKGQEIYDKIKGNPTAAAAPVAPAPNQYGLGNDVSDQLDAAFG